MFSGAAYGGRVVENAIAVNQFFYKFFWLAFAICLATLASHFLALLDRPKEPENKTGSD